MINITEKTLENCKWEKIDSTRAERIVAACDKYGMKGIYDELSIIYKSIAVSLNLPYLEVCKAIKSMNVVFYESLNKFQHEFMLYNNPDSLNTYLAYLILPESSINMVKCLEFFFSLSNDEKDYVVKELNSYTALVNS